MKKNYKLIILFTFIVLTCWIVAYLLLPNDLKPKVIIANFLPKNNEISKTEEHRLKLFENESEKNPDECQNVLEKIKTEDLVKNNNNYSVRFENLHFKMDGDIFRTREFYDYAPEGEVKSYLVYSEDLEENTNLLEKSKNNPGKKFTEFKNFMQNNPSSIIFFERGYESKDNQDYLIYTNGTLAAFQGTYKESKLECHFN